MVERDDHTAERGDDLAGAERCSMLGGGEGQDGNQAGRSVFAAHPTPAGL
jgi:hypothetical protein